MLNVIRLFYHNGLSMKINRYDKFVDKKTPWLSQGDSNLIIVQIDLDLLVLLLVDQLFLQCVRVILF